MKRTKKIFSGLMAALLVMLTLSTAIPMQAFAAEEYGLFDSVFELGKPRKVEAETTNTTIALKWNEVRGATGYRIYNNKGGKWKVVVSGVSETNYTFKDLVPGTTYTLAVRAYKIENGTVIWANDYTVIDAKTKGGAPGKTAELKYSSTGSSVTLEWKAVDGATGYRVYRKTSDGWKGVGDTTKTTYTISNLKANSSYTFAVKAYRRENNKVIWANEFATVTAATAIVLKKPAKITYTAADTSATINWSTVDGATGYRIYKHNGKQWKAVVFATTKTEYTFSNLEANKSYNYAVRAYRLEGRKVIWADDYATIKVTTKKEVLGKPGSISYSASKSSISLSWSAVNGATGYRIYNLNGGKWKGVVDTKNTAYTFSGLKADKTYTLAVRAYKVTNGKVEWAPTYTTITVKTTVTSLG